MVRFDRVKIVIFDNDGTLVPSHIVANPAIQEGFVQFCRRHAIEASLPSDERLRELTGLPGVEFYRALLPEGEKGRAAELRERCLDFEEAAMLAKAEFYPGVLELLQILRRRGARLAVATNGGERYVSAVATRLGYSGLFDRVYFLGFEGLTSKGAMARRAVSDLAPGPAVFVGDRKADFDAAKEAGIPFVGCLYGYGSPDELEGADALASTPSELAALFSPAV